MPVVFVGAGHQVDVALVFLGGDLGEQLRLCAAGSGGVSLGGRHGNMLEVDLGREQTVARIPTRRSAPDNQSGPAGTTE